MVGRWDSYWEGIFSGNMLVFGRVSNLSHVIRSTFRQTEVNKNALRSQALKKRKWWWWWWWCLSSLPGLPSYTGIFLWVGGQVVCECEGLEKCSMSFHLESIASTNLQFWEFKGTWRIILLGKWLGSSSFISHKQATWKGSHNPYVWGLTITMDAKYLKAGVILHLHPTLHFSGWQRGFGG